MARRLDYFFRESLSGLSRNFFLALAAISTSFIALFLLGGALLAGRQVNLLIEQSTANVEVSVFLRDGISGIQQQHLQQLLLQMPEVDTAHYESKAEAFQRFREIFKNEQDLVENVSPDALPASFRVKLEDPEKFEVVAARLAGQPGIDKIVDQRDVLKRLFAVARVFRVGVTMVAVIMLVAAGLLIGNTVRMAVFARRKEIGIMRLVGATNWFIRMPFMIEGVFEGLFGAAVAILFLFAGKVVFIDSIRNQVGFLPMIGTPDVIWTIPWLLIIGVAVSVFAGFLAMLRYLEV
jgi:cell division transport system permease protein